MPKGLTPIRSNHRNDQLHTCCISYLLVTQRDPSFPFRIDYEFKGRFLPEGTSTPITAKLTLVTDFTFHRLPLSLFQRYQRSPFASYHHLFYIASLSRVHETRRKGHFPLDSPISSVWWWWDGVCSDTRGV